RARATLALAVHKARSAPSEARALLGEAQRDVKRLRRERASWADGLAWLTQAGCAQLRSDEEAARLALTRAVETLEANDMSLFAAAARHRLAPLSGGQDGLVHAKAAQSWLARHDIVSPARMLAMVTPVFDASV